MASEENFIFDQSVISRFFSKIDKSGPMHPYSRDKGKCWNWLGCVARGNYGQLWMGGKMRLASRFSLSFHVHPPRKDDEVLHSCDNPLCVNPKHIGWGTHKKNMEERLIRTGYHHGIEHHNAKLDDEKVRAIRSSSLSIASLAKIYSVSEATISSVLKRETWKHVK